MKNLWITSLLSFSLFLASACTVKHESPSQTFMPNMAYTSVYKAQEGQFGLANNAMRVPVAGTIPRDFVPYPYEGEFSLYRAQAASMKNPLPSDRETFYKGKALFNSVCAACHAADGEGDSPVVRAGFPRPTSLSGSTAIGRSDGELFHLITVGFNNMPAYGRQTTEQERWAIVRYLRALQKSQNPTDRDLKEAEKW